MRRMIDLKQEAWITPTLLNGATGTLQYMKDSFGFVHFKGNITVPGGADVEALTMPKGYRVSEDTHAPVWDYIKNIVGNVSMYTIGYTSIGSGTYGSTVTANITIAYKGV